MRKVSEMERDGLDDDFGHRQIVVFGHSGEFFMELRRNFEGPGNPWTSFFFPFQ